MNRGALEGLVVLDLTTHLSGPFCGMQLADMGADVIKIESPAGDSIRGAPPFVEGEGAPFMLWNRNKRGIVLAIFRQPGTNTIQIIYTNTVTLSDARTLVVVRPGDSDGDGVSDLNEVFAHTDPFSAT